MLAEDEVGLKEKPEDSRYMYIKIITSEMRPESPGVWAKDLISNFAIIGNCRLGNGQRRHSLEGSGGGVKSKPRRTAYHDNECMMISSEQVVVVI